MTVRDLIRKSMLLGGLIASSESMTDDEATDALDSLNDLIESWTTEGLLLFNSVREVFDLASGTQSYILGTGQTWNTTKPQNIEAISAISNNIEYPLRIYTIEEWQEISQKNLQSQLPEGVYIEESAASIKFYFYPTPSDSSVDIIIHSRKPLSAFSNLSDTVSLPQGYTRALRYDLAIELMQEYGRDPSAVVIEKTNELKGALKRDNIDGVIMSNDIEIGGFYIWDINKGPAQ